MAHAAQIDTDNQVAAVIVIPDDLGGDENDAAIQEYINKIGIPGHWIRTSYNAAVNGFRGYFAGIGFTYDPSLDVFVPPPAPEPTEE
jgi:hypothetical protein